MPGRDVDDHRRGFVSCVRPACAALLLAVVAAGCASGSGSASSSGPAVVAAGQLPPSAVLVGGNRSGAGSEGTTIPLAKQDPTTALFTAIGSFQSCLKGLGVTFAGVPSAGNPNSPTNSPAYIKGLTTCAAQSNIVQALKTEQTAQDDLTPKQVANENKIYIKWRVCMIGRGWVVPPPKPDAKGALFSFGASGGSGPQLTPPAGESLLSSPDIQACVALAQKGKT
ncbi:MAG TPA: hypothetical protein VIJ09_14435 [Acidimicrobiales bacterium]